MERVVHAKEIGGYGPPLGECERILEGEGPWELEGGGTLILQALNPQPSTLNHEPSTLNPQP